ncbi:hypothetical protein BCV69DRAFT_295926 [Microstroma glucosiphilum]|uniref:Uncharacterized protein n=1 Tax=Pseudomicrostroma glucosiphilum TaxID=1684307 RepID=A0A316UEH1_9BASI|nr:hypothetical protein BCV69DRAFT_295926 [Pseudomicrostroma glucosiphilum]PWN23610.1 hypothetical protein BCV69DRAFT_295926 [Pseudomicrostroma glucosiphilum]
MAGASSSRRPRKMFAYRSPSASSSSASSSSSSIGPTRSTPASATVSHSPYPTPTILFSLLHDSTPVQYEHLLSSTNSRYPGAPGTALAKAREASIKAAQAAKREADKKRRDKEELIRLGVGEKMGKRSRDTASAHKRSESPFTGNGNGNGNGHSTTSATRRSQREKDKDKTGDGEAHDGRRSRGTSVVRSPALNGNALSSEQPQQSNDMLSVPGTSHAVNGSGRIRKPASRGNSPIPLTEARKSPERINGHSTVHGLGLNTPTSNGGIVHAATRLGAANPTQPFQSSPLARDSIKSFPSISVETEPVEPPMTTRSRKGGSHSPSLVSTTEQQPSQQKLAGIHEHERKGESGGDADDDSYAAEGKAGTGGAPAAEADRRRAATADGSTSQSAATGTEPTPAAPYGEGVNSTSSPILPAGITA